MLRFGPVRFGFTSVYFGILMFGAVRFGTLSTRPLPPSSPSTPATQPQTTPDLTPPGGAGGGGAGGGETVRFGATKQARFGTVPVRFGTILQESIVETPMYKDPQIHGPYSRPIIQTLATQPLPVKNPQVLFSSGKVGLPGLEFRV